MAKGGEKGAKNETPVKERSEPNVSRDDDLDALFQLPLAEFTTARNALSSRLKKAGLGSEAERVKQRAKAPVSAWAVNQLYWKHRDAFSRLMAAGEDLRRAHASQLAGKSADTRAPLATRREAFSELARLAAALLGDAGHNASPDTMRRITTTLEAISTYSGLSGGPRPGRLTADVDPPGFESLAALMPASGPAERPQKPAPVAAFRPPEGGVSKQKAEKAALEIAGRALREAEVRMKDAEAALHKARADAKQAEQESRDAETRFAKAKAAEEKARDRENSLAAETELAANALQEAKRSLEEARQTIADE
jgi:hypothetical protein